LGMGLGRMAKVGYVYIITNAPNGTLYTGVTAYPVRRIGQHRRGVGSVFAAQHGLDRLVYIERHGNILDAIGREKRVKRWRRAWKLELIRGQNPTWKDLYDALCDRFADGR